MTLLVTVHSNNGIVVASDSRLTTVTRGYQPVKGGICITEQSGFVSDSGNKTMLIGGCSISVCGKLEVGNKSVLSEISEELGKIDTVGPGALASKVYDILEKSGLDGVVALVSGYERTSMEVRPTTYRVNMIRRSVDIACDGGCHVVFEGIAGIMERLTLPVYRKRIAFVHEEMAPLMFPFDTYSLQDAVDFCQFAIRTTEEVLRFSKTESSVGGPIDVAVITPDRSRWLCLHGVSVNTLYNPYIYGVSVDKKETYPEKALPEESGNRVSV